jgi:hypothetical protein
MTLLKSDLRDNVAGEISAITEKTALSPTDLLLIEDSEDSYAKKSIKVSHLLGDNVGDSLKLLLSATILSTDEVGWISGPAIWFYGGTYSYTTAYLVVIGHTSNASHPAEFRLWNVTTGAAATDILAIDTTTPSIGAIEATLAAGANIYELQYRQQDVGGYIATCVRAEISLEA